MVLFTKIKDPAPGKWISQVVEPPSRSACIFEALVIAIHQEFWLTNANRFIRLHHLNDWLYPTGSHFYIGVQQYIIISLQFFQRFVVSARKSKIFFQFNNANC